MKRTILLLTILLLGTQSFGQDISASYSNSSFEEEFYVDTLQSIEMWEQPKTQYTPKNLVSEQQMRFNGKEGARTYNSYTLHLTDYDTKITESYFKDGKFYIKDNTGRSFQTGELQEIDTSALEEAINNNTTRIENNTQAIQNNATNIQNNTTQINKNTKAIQDNSKRIEQNSQAIQNNTENISKLDTQVQNNKKLIKVNSDRIDKVDTQVQSNTQNINALKNDVSRLNTRMDGMQSQINRLDDKIERGLATVTALTALHPNPRHQGKTQVSVGAGMYSDNVAGAIGVFHYLNDKVMLSAGASYGGNDSFAGNVGITIGF